IFLTTGGSTVEEAVLTNSPCSFRVARSFLLVTPSFFASSCTRSFPATTLLRYFGAGGLMRKGYVRLPLTFLVSRWCRFIVRSSVQSAFKHVGLRQLINR